MTYTPEVIDPAWYQALRGGSHITHRHDDVGTLRPTTCDDCRTALSLLRKALRKPRCCRYQDDPLHTPESCLSNRRSPKAGS